MEERFVPELHDIAKLCRITEELKEGLGLSSQAAQDEIGVLPQSLGLPVPATGSWQVIAEHHEEQRPRTLRASLLTIADHAGSGVSRVVARSERGIKVAEADLYRSVYKLWNPKDQQALALLASVEELRSLVQWLGTDPGSPELFQRYGALLEIRPEELLAPLNTTSLASHLTIVGKVYRFLERHVQAVATSGADRWEYLGKSRSHVVSEAENSWPVDLVRARVGFPQQIVRTRDMSLFDLLAGELQRVSSDDRVLVTTFNQALALLTPDEGLESLFGPLLDAGFVVAWERARTTVGHLHSTPATLRLQRVARLSQELSRVPEAHRSEALARRWDEIDDEYPRGVSMAPLVERLAPPICDLCQIERATAVWPPDPQMPGPRENLGERCYALRQKASRLFKLDRWTQEPTAPVAWVLVDLDLDRLVAFLRPLYQQYAASAGWPADMANRVDVRPPLLAEFQKDYNRFLHTLAASLSDLVGDNCLERVGGESGAAANTLMCARLAHVAQIPLILNLYLDAVKRYFPVAVDRRVRAPFRLCVSVSGARFPFSEHWRVMQAEGQDILVNVVGRGQICLPLGSLPFLIAAGQPRNRKVLHDLAEVARMSEALARVYMNEKGRGHDRQYQWLVPDMEPLGLTYEGLVTYAGMLEG